MGHGTPLKTSGSEACGSSGPFMLEAGISSTRHIARFWGLTDRVRAEEMKTTEERMASQPDSPIFDEEILPHFDARISVSTSQPKPQRIVEGVGAIIEKALRQAGLMR